jgi:hypothetical protein
MRVAIVVVFLLAAAGVAAYMTRPAQGWHRGVAVALMEEGKVKAPDTTSGKYLFEDFYVVTLSTMTSGEGTLLQCWGVYSRFLCMGPAAPTQATDAATG